MLFTLNSHSPTPLHTQLSDCIRHAIARGEAEVGERLPSARDLADSLGVNMHTVLRAYNDLRDEGVLDVRRGRGAVIKSGAVRNESVDNALAHAIQLAQKHNVPPQHLIHQINLAFTKEPS